YKRYLRLDLEAQDMAALHSVQGLAESRLRSGVVVPLEMRSMTSNGFIEVLHTLARWFSSEDLGEEPPKDRCRISLFVGYQTPEQYGSLDITDILHQYNTGLIRTGIMEKDQIRWSGVKASKLPKPIRPAKAESKSKKSKKGKSKKSKEAKEGKGASTPVPASASATETHTASKAPSTPAQGTVPQPITPAPPTPTPSAPKADVLE
ncbi:hypothetical protein KIPB_007330, partial [Kipferlia bialata]